MNDLQGAQQGAPIIYTKEQARDAFSMANLIFNPQALASMHQICDILSKNSGMVPKHFQGKPNDIMAVIIQSSRWGLELFSVMQSTFVLNGKIGYEAKIIQSVVQANGGVIFETEYYGDWSKINGNTKTIKKTKSNASGQRYEADITVAAWGAQDEQGVGIRTTGIFPDGRKVTIDVPLNTCYPRNSTNWVYDPETQIHYTSVKRWVRRYAPHLGAGIQDFDDMKAAEDREEKVVNPTRKATVKPPENQTPKGGPEDIDAFLNLEEKEPLPTMFQDLCNVVNNVNTKVDFEHVRDTCTAVVDSGELETQEIDKIRDLLEAKREQLYRLNENEE